MDNFLVKQAETDNKNANGFDAIDSNTISVPYIKLAQDLTPECKKSSSNYMEGLEPGLFFNSLTKENYGKSFSCIVIGFERVYLEFRQDRGGFVGYHTPSEAEAITVSTEWGKWATSDGNDLVETYIYKVLIEGKENEGVCLISLTSVNIKEAKKWNRLMITTNLDNGQKALPWYIVWAVSSVYEENNKGSFFKWCVKKKGFINEGQYHIAKGERELLDVKKIDYAKEDNENKEEVIPDPTAPISNDPNNTQGLFEY